MSKIEKGFTSDFCPAGEGAGRTEDTNPTIEPIEKPLCRSMLTFGNAEVVSIIAQLIDPESSLSRLVKNREQTLQGLST